MSGDLNITIKISGDGTKFDYKNIDKYNGSAIELHEFISEKIASILTHIYEVNSVPDEGEGK